MNNDLLHKALDEALSAAHATGYGKGYKDAVDNFYCTLQPMFEPQFVGDEAVGIIDWSKTRVRSNDEIGSDSGDECDCELCIYARDHH
jgi:hypothetical protein